MELFTVFALVCALASGLSAYVAYRQACFASADADNLKQSTFRITALEAEIDTLRSAVAKLRGKVYATKAEPALVPDERAPAMLCENWARAQSDGPRSAAARCECDYCSYQRMLRAQVRAAILPRTPTARGNGSE